jgi:hypothetical protein
MFGRILITFITVCSFAMADIENLDKYPINVKAIDEEFHAVALSNGLICNVTPKHFWLEKNLEVGEEVELFPNVWPSFIEQEGSIKDSGEFTLTLCKDKTLITIDVWVTEESKKTGLIYTSDTVRIIQPAGWLSQAVKKTIIELSNGSKWVSNNGQTFAKGDHVIPLYSKKFHQWWLVNLDKSTDIKATKCGPFCMVTSNFEDMLIGFNAMIFVTPLFEENSNAP